MAATASLLRGRADRYVVCWQMAELGVKGDVEAIRKKHSYFHLSTLHRCQSVASCYLARFLRMNAPKPPDDPGANPQCTVSAPSKGGM
jgi:hypothetical protein